jgi:hypothetical protein
VGCNKCRKHRSGRLFSGGMQNWSKKQIVEVFRRFGVQGTAFLHNTQ